MKHTTVLFTWFCLLFIPMAQAQKSEVATPTSSRIYELYSWRGSNGAWNFSLLPNTSSEKSVRLVFDKKVPSHGLDQLKKTISLLPEGATIALLDRLPTGTGPKAKGSERLTYPPPDVLAEIRRYAATNKIEVVGGSATK
jgi:hypothetical protein